MDTRTEKKRQAIMAAAAKVFLHNGYVGASMDEVAALAAVSKQTVYKHFSNKERLFTEMVLSSIGPVEEMFRSAAGRLAVSQDLEADLTELARRFVGFLMQPDTMKLRRLVIAEADRFPEVGRTFYAQGPELVTDILSASFADLADRGQLQVDDPKLAAYHYCWLVLSIPWNQVLFGGASAEPSAVELNRYADAGVKVFLAAHRKPKKISK